MRSNNNLWFMNNNQFKKLFACPVCKLEYEDQNVAQDCENWCREEKGCE